MRKIEILNRVNNLKDIERYDLSALAKQLISEEDENVLHLRPAEIQISIRIYESPDEFYSFNNIQKIH